MCSECTSQPSVIIVALNNEKKARTVLETPSPRCENTSSRINSEETLQSPAQEASSTGTTPASHRYLARDNNYQQLIQPWTWVGTTGQKDAQKEKGTEDGDHTLAFPALPAAHGTFVYALKIESHTDVLAQKNKQASKLNKFWCEWSSVRNDFALSMCVRFQATTVAEAMNSKQRTSTQCTSMWTCCVKKQWSYGLRWLNREMAKRFWTRCRAEMS